MPKYAYIQVQSYAGMSHPEQVENHKKKHLIPYETCKKLCR